MVAPHLARLRLLRLAPAAVAGRFNFHFWHLHIGVVASTVAFGHMVLRWAQHSLYGKAIARTRIDKPPIFILGHWRTGTTLLHEMMILDPRHGYPNNYHCLDPNHVLLTEEHFKKWFKFLLPSAGPWTTWNSTGTGPRKMSSPCACLASLHHTSTSPSQTGRR